MTYCIHRPPKRGLCACWAGLTLRVREDWDNICPLQ